MARAQTLVFYGNMMKVFVFFLLTGENNSEIACFIRMWLMTIAIADV